MGQAAWPPSVPCPSMLSQQLSELPLPIPPTWTLPLPTPTLVSCLSSFQMHRQRDLTTDWPPLPPLEGPVAPHCLQGTVQLLSQAHQGPQAQPPCCFLVLAPTRISMGVSSPDLCLLPTLAFPNCRSQSGNFLAALKITKAWEDPDDSEGHFLQLPHVAGKA